MIMDLLIMNFQLYCHLKFIVVRNSRIRWFSIYEKLFFELINNFYFCNMIKDDIRVGMFGDKLYRIPQNYDLYDYYPSPKELLHKIVLKGKGDFYEIASNLYPE